MVYLAALAAMALIHTLLVAGRPDEAAIHPRGSLALSLLVVAGILTLVIGTRLDTGVDFAQYAQHFQWIAEEAPGFSREPLYVAVGQFVHGLGAGEAAFFVTLAAITNLALVAGIFLLRPRYPFLVIAGLFGLGLVLAQTNAVRQMMATALFLPALAMIAHRHWAAWTGMLAGAAAFHYPVALLYPLYWILGRRLSASLLTLALLAGLFGLVALPMIAHLLSGPLAEFAPPRYAAHLQEALSGRQAISSGAGVLAIWLIGAISLGWLHRSGHLNRLENRERVVVNTALLGIAANTALAALPIVHRMADYLMVAVPLLASIVVAATPIPRERRLVYSLFLLAFIARFAYDLLSGTHGAYPYQSRLFDLL